MAPMLRGMPPATFSRRLPRLGIAIGVLWISFAVFLDAWGRNASEPFAFKTTIPRSRYELVLALYD